MNKTNRRIVIALLMCAVGAVLVMKRNKPETEPSPPPAEHPAAATNAASASRKGMEAGEVLPRLVDLGAGKCIPCKMMAPILEELRKACADTFAVEFIDVWENPKAGEKYGIRVIPTQIFYDASGKELFRHEGFFGKEDILAKWKEYGVTVATESKP